MPPRLALVIVTVGSSDNLAKCLTSLAAQTMNDFEVVVVSNRNHEQVAKIIEQTAFAPRPLHVIGGERLGYGGACNLGARKSNTPFLVFLNDDTCFKTDWAAELLKGLAAEPKSILQSMVVHESTSQTRTGNPCDVYGAAGITFYKGCGKGEFYASGACIAMSREVFNSLGGFDEALYMYGEDVDLCWRGWIHGWKTVYVPGAKCWHRVSHSSQSGQGRRMSFRGVNNGRLVFATKLLPLSYVLRAWLMSLGGLARDVALLHWPEVLDRLWVLLGCLGRVPALLRERHELFHSEATSPQNALDHLLQLAV